MQVRGEAETSAIWRELVRRIWRRLRSRNLAIAALVFLGAIMILGLMLPQADQIGPDAYAKWQKENPQLAWIVGATGLSQLFSNWGFLLIAGALYVNTLACTTNQIQTAIKLMVAKPQLPTLRFLLSARHSFALESRQTPARISEAVQPLLNEKGYRVKVSPDSTDVLPADDHFHIRLHAEKGKLGVLGSPVLHLGLLMALTAVAWSGLTRFEGFVEVAEGQVFKESDGVYGQQSEGPLFRNSHAGFEVRIDRVELEAPIVVGRVQDQNARTMVSIMEEGKEVAKETLQVNQSLDYRGVRLYQGRTFGPGAVFLLEYGDGRANRGMVNLAHNDGSIYSNSFFLPGTSYSAEVDVDTSNNATSIKILKGIDSIFSGAISPDQEIRFDELSLRLVDIRPWTSVRVVTDRSQPLLFSGFFITVIGLLMSAFFERREIWLLVGRDGDSSRIVCAGIAAKARAMFAEEFDEIRNELVLTKAMK